MLALSETFGRAASLLARSLPGLPGTRCRVVRARAVRVAALSLVVLAVACAGKEHSPGSDEFNAYQAQRLFTAGYQDIAKVYIEDVEIAVLAKAAIDNVAEADSGVSVVQRGDTLVVRPHKQSPRSFALPADRNDAEAWAELTVSAIDAARDQSPKLYDKSGEDLYDLAFEGILSELDYFSRYAGVQQAQDNRASRDGFGGIGVRIQPVEEGISVLSVVQDSPADEAGLRSGDVIVSVDGTSTQQMAQREVVERLRGVIDTSVELTVTRNGTPEPMAFTVQRAHIVPETVRYTRKGDAAYLRVSGFNQDTADALRRAVREAQRDIGGDLKGYVLDLRGNPGGLLDQAVAVADVFVGGGRIVSTHGRHPDSHQYFSARRGDLGEDLPVVALINGSSASASEIVAAAIQDSGRGIVIGSGSYGKGTVQTVLRLPNRGELTLTWARFHAPSGYALSKRGVIPDICTSAHHNDFSSVMAGLRRGTFPMAAEIKSADVDPLDLSAVNSFRAHCPGAREERSVDMEVAMELLERPDLYRMAGGTESSKVAGIPQ